MQHNPEVPVLGQGQQPTRQEMAQMQRVHELKMAMPFIQVLLSDLPYNNQKEDYWSPAEVFNYAMAMVGLMKAYEQPPVSEIIS